ncbi:MAG: [Clostridia bacterium]|nr:[FeFe] hydrogenase H-cluster maturation GTPase HydF [Clostridia bacterium]
MSLNDTVSAERVHIGFFGMRNAGKSSLVNAVTGQSLSVVSPVKGTTTDPVQKAMELLPLGPVVILDTPGLDDEGDLGALRVQKAMQALQRTDIAVLVTDGTQPLSARDEEMIALFKKKNVPYLVARSKCDLPQVRPQTDENTLCVSAVTGENIRALKERLAAMAKEKKNDRPLVSDLLSDGDVAVLVTPIDESAPKGRMILPQQQTMRDILDHGNTFMTCQPAQLPFVLRSLREKPKLVVTDSQAFASVSKNVPDDVLLTSFSILFARYKGNLPTLVRGAAQLAKLTDTDTVLISEGCTHHRQCGDIGTVKLPAWIRKYSGASPSFAFTSGREYPEDLSPYALVVHCGGCMLNETEMQNRISAAAGQGVPIVNYGVAIAQMHGILRRSLEPFPDVLDLIS